MTTDPSKPDPRFPDRPTHPDFVDLSWAAQTNDAESDAGRLEERLADFIDADSLHYMIFQRATRVCQLKGETDPKILMAYAAALMDGFMLGAAYERGRTERDPR